MKTIKTLLAAAAAAVSFAGMASAATLSGTFTLEVVRITNADTSESAATLGNFNTQFGAVGATTATGSYMGDLSFRIGSGGSDTTTIADFLDSAAGGSWSFASGSLTGDETLSFPDVFNGTATTTLFKFSLASLGAGDFSINHDDGMSIAGLGELAAAPTSEITTILENYAGGSFDLIYAATNGNPSVLEVDYEAAAVPLPASLPLLLAGFGGLAVIRRRKKAA